ncbi:DUF4235 domain-containing protein [Nocardia rosealba]|uniref:DUF4235 domain-containing protein n=1 Tax=Nocardia TaxID=1817 RepID=UPI001CD92529|nr:DUF4235 domain-containing protein [Nocardia rosealba]MCA2207459.1 DUF4235 domain-containing protein [Nocardia rosealba]
MKTLYKPLGMVVGVVGGIAASAVFNRVWGAVADGGDPPTSTTRNATWREVLLAAALQGAIFGLVKAAVDRAGATGYKSLTGTWPD